MANEENAYYAVWRPDDDKLYEISGYRIKERSDNEDMYIVYREDPGDAVGEGTVYHVRNEDADPWKPDASNQSSTILDTDWVVATYSNTTYKLSGSRFKELFRPLPLALDRSGSWSPTSSTKFYYGDTAICEYTDATFKDGIPPYSIEQKVTESFVGNVGFIDNLPGGNFTPTTAEYIELARHSNYDAIFLNAGQIIKFRVYLDRTSYISSDSSSSTAMSWQRGGTISGYTLSWDVPNRSDQIKINGSIKTPTQNSQPDGSYLYTGSIVNTSAYTVDYEVEALVNGTVLRHVTIFAGMDGNYILGSGMNRAYSANGDANRYPIFERTWGGRAESLTEWDTDMYQRMAQDFCTDQINDTAQSYTTSSAKADISRAYKYYEETILGSPRITTTAVSSGEDDLDPDSIYPIGEEG